MKFSKGTVSLTEDQIVFSYRYGWNKITNIKIVKEDFKEYSYFKDKPKLRLKNWIIVLIHVGMIFLYGYVRSILEDVGYSDEILATLDIIFIPLLTLLIVLLMVEILGEFRLLRRFYSFLFTRKKSYLRIVLKSGKAYKIPIRNENEAISIMNFIEAKN